MGNHDNRMSVSDMELLKDIFASLDHCIFEAGDSALGFGNYIVTVEQDGSPLSALFMMDSHDESRITINGRERYVSDELTEPQLQWYSENAKHLAKTGCDGFFDVRMCGGTVLTVNADGKMTVRHEYVDVTKLCNNK